MNFAIVYKERARKDLKKIPQAWREKLICAIDELKTDPFRGKKLQGALAGIYSLRVWPYSVLYQINKGKILIIILHVGHRQGVYSN